MLAFSNFQLVGKHISLGQRQSKANNSQFLVSFSEGGHLDPSLKLPACLLAIDYQHQGALHPDHAEFLLAALVQNAYGCEVGLCYGHSVPYDDPLARAEVVCGDHYGCAPLVYHDEGEGDRVLCMNTANHNS